MKSIFLVVVIGFCGLFLGGCAANSPQFALRGNPNSPWVNMQYLQIDPNAMLRMSPRQRAEAQKFIEDHNYNVSVMLRNDRYAAKNAQIWKGDVNKDRYSVENTLKRNFDYWLRDVVRQSRRR